LISDFCFVVLLSLDFESHVLVWKVCCVSGSAAAGHHHF
jgi:hypothetical protein